MTLMSIVFSLTDVCSLDAASITVFTQGTAMYVGGDSGSFAARYPSPVVNLVRFPVED
jgi:hypothetical protein